MNLCRFLVAIFFNLSFGIISRRIRTSPLVTSMIFGAPSTGFPVARDAKTSRSPNSLTCRRPLFLVRRTCFCRAKFAEHFAPSAPRRIYRFYRCDDARLQSKQILAFVRFYPTVLRTPSHLPSQNNIEFWETKKKTDFTSHLK